MRKRPKRPSDEEIVLARCAVSFQGPAGYARCAGFDAVAGHLDAITRENIAALKAFLQELPT